MQILQIPSARGHDTIEFDRKTGTGVKEAMERFNEIVAEHKGTGMTRNKGETDYHKVDKFEDTQDETTFLLQRQGG